jgi:hypothetical protein
MKISITSQTYNIHENGNNQPNNPHFAASERMKGKE